MTLNATHRPLKVGLILPTSRALPPGVRRLLCAMGSNPNLSLVLTERRTPAKPVTAPVFHRLLDVERRFFANDKAPHAASNATAGTEAPDVMVDFTGSADAIDIARAATFGLWRLSAYAPDFGITEARLRCPTTDVALTCEVNDELRTIAMARYDTKFLATRNVAFAQEKSVQLLLRELSRLAIDRALPPHISGPAVPPAPLDRDLPDYLFSVARELTFRAWRAVEGKLGRRPGRFFLRLSKSDPLTVDLAQGVDLVAPGNAYWADPFLFEHDDETYVFFEEYDYGTHKGHLAVGRIVDDELELLGPALERPYHLSYPFIFRWNDEILMIPETNKAKRIEVWRATEFPLKWELAATALEGEAPADTVVFERDGAWWMLTNLCRDSFGDNGTELHLYRVDDPLLGNPRAHPLNPVVIDVTSARGGGRVFERDGRLFRSSQDNSHGIYGYGQNLMEITTLSDSDYREHRVRHLTADGLPGLMATHHMDSVGEYTVVDLRKTYTGLHRSGRGQDQNPAAQEHQHDHTPYDGNGRNRKAEA